MVGIGFILALVLPTLLWLTAVGDPRLYLDPSIPTGQLPYIASKLAGLLAVGLFTLQLLLMVVRNTRSRPGMVRWSSRAHFWLGFTVLGMITIHIGLFVLAASLRSGHFAVQLLLPRFQNGFYDAMVSVGAIAFYSIVLLVVIGVISRRKSLRGSGRKRLHRILVLVSVPLIIAHSFAIGSETNSITWLVFYGVLCSGSLAGLVLALRRKSFKSIAGRS